jgi:hypothetical protein
MQLDYRSAEREAMRLLPELIEDLFDQQGERFRIQAEGVGHDRGFDLVGEGFGRDWLFEVKASSSPGLISRAAASRELQPADALYVVVVPFMTPAGEKTAQQLGLNWIDLSGNAHIRADRLYIHVTGKASRFVQRGRPSTPFAPKSARITRVMLLEPEHWWQQKDLAATTDLDSGHVSRVVRRLTDDGLLEQEDRRIRPRRPAALLDAWEDEYRFDRHQVLRGHMSGTGIELARELEERLAGLSLRHAFTGLASAWAYRRFARFRLNSVFVEGDPYLAADRVGLRRNDRGANVQLIVPDDAGVFAGAKVIDGLTCVSAVQAYLDLKHLPERAAEAAENLREGLWDGA